MKTIKIVMILVIVLVKCKGHIVKHVIEETDKTIKGISRVVTGGLFGGIRLGFNGQVSASSEGEGSDEQPTRPGLFGLSGLFHHRQQEDHSSHRVDRPDRPLGNEYQSNYPPGVPPAGYGPQRPRFPQGGQNSYPSGGASNPEMGYLGQSAHNGHNHEHRGDRPGYHQENNQNGYGGHYGNDQGERNTRPDHSNFQNQNSYQENGYNGNNQGGRQPQPNYQNSHEFQQNNDQGVINGHYQGNQQPQEDQNQNKFQPQINDGNKQEGQQYGNIHGQQENTQAPHPTAGVAKEVDKQKPTLIALAPGDYKYDADGIKVKEPMANNDDDDDFGIDIRTAFDEDQTKKKTE